MTVDLLEGLAGTVGGALTEDAADRDITTQGLIDPSVQGKGEFLAKANGVLAGLPVAHEVFTQVDAGLAFTPLMKDGESLIHGTVFASVSGSLASILSGERVALNFLQHLSGIATAANTYAQAVSGTGAVVLDTRKTTPGLRKLEKYAVGMGGATNHRMDLSDGVLIKDNHLQALRGQGWNMARILEQARKASSPSATVEVEVTSVAEAREAIDAGAEIILLDNMSFTEMREAVAAASGRCKTEASGSITLETVRQVAETGVDFISVGALTHSVKALDISLEVL